MAEAQAINRIHRIGQEREVEVVRYIVNDSIEPVRTNTELQVYFRSSRTNLSSQYVQWVQKDKERLIQESLSASVEPPDDPGDIRWKVSSEECRTPEDSNTLNHSIRNF